ncbi:vacuolar protein sorting-associated protein 13A-like, partial [Elysia marginata]
MLENKLEVRNEEKSDLHICLCMVWRYKLKVDFEKMELLKPRQCQIRRSFSDGIWVQMRTSPHSRQFHAKINRLQFDNQLRQAVFPTILAPIPPPKSVAADS